MRTTYTPAPDVEAEIRRLRKELGIGVSEAINMLARRGMMAGGQPRQRFHQRSASMGAKIPIDDIGAVLDQLDHS
ncbi:MAG: CopG family transcriptional regulator [Candidatus Nanopelagicales bacterium]